MAFTLFVLEQRTDQLLSTTVVVTFGIMKVFLCAQNCDESAHNMKVVLGFWL